MEIRGTGYILPKYSTGDLNMQNQTTQSNNFIEPEEFGHLLTFLRITKKPCDDLCIQNGTFRTRSYDQTCIIEAQFPYLKSASFNIKNISEIVNGLSNFPKRSRVTLTTGEDVTFTDGKQSVCTRNMSSEESNNQYLGEEELNEAFVNDMDLSRPLLKDSLDKKNVMDIHKMTKSRGFQGISIKHSPGDYDSGYFSIQNGTNVATFNLKRKFLEPMKADHYFAFSSIPFIFTQNKMGIEIYHSNRDDDTLMIKFNTHIGYKMLVNLYCRSAYIPIEI
jgi:hypothetical protein